MANDENTAVNELIARASGGARVRGAEQGRAEPAPRPSRPVAAPYEAQLPTSYPVVSRAAIEPEDLPVDPTASPTWAHGAPQRPSRPSKFKPEHMVGTIVVRRSDRQASFSKLIVPMAVLVGVGMVIGGYVAIHGMRGSPEAPRAEVAATVRHAPAATPIDNAPRADSAAPSVEPAKPALVDVRIDSRPSGATVMSIENGRTQLIGDTPISAAFDPAREYDLVFTYPGQPTQVAHLAPRTMPRIAVTLGAPAVAPVVPAAPAAHAPPARVEKHAEPARSERAERSAPRAVEHRAEPKAEPKPAAEAAAAGQGTLMISSKPPCEIWIDGAATGLTTPQRAIPLSAGAHKITLVNAEKDLRKTVRVQITADETEKVIEDLQP